MTETTEEIHVHDDEHEIESRYKPPPEKSIEEIVAADQEDESLRKYKEALLGEAKEGKIIVGTFISIILFKSHTVYGNEYIINTLSSNNHLVYYP